MAEETIKFPTPADPSIQKILDEFLVECIWQIGQDKIVPYQETIYLFRDFINAYAVKQMNTMEKHIYDIYTTLKMKIIKDIARYLDLKESLITLDLFFISSNRIKQYAARN